LYFATIPGSCDAETITDHIAVIPWILVSVSGNSEGEERDRWRRETGSGEILAYKGTADAPGGSASLYPRFVAERGPEAGVPRNWVRGQRARNGVSASIRILSYQYSYHYQNIGKKDFVLNRKTEKGVHRLEIVLPVSPGYPARIF
jgi:hypothetical protein